MDIRHVTSVDTFDETNLAQIFATAARLKWGASPGAPLAGRIIAMLFYEASTRTRLSFEAAALKLGASTIGTENAKEFSSAVKGETLEDTIRVTSGNCDAIVLRHSENDASERAARASRVPIINAGSGTAEHPTQALLDLFTLHERFPERTDLTVTFVGDLRHGRTVHSLGYLLATLAGSQFGKAAKFHFVAPDELGIGTELPALAREAGITCEQHSALTERIVGESDVVYMTRPQLERHHSSTELATGSVYAFSEELAACLQPDAIIMHPLPRNAELPEILDTLPQARYFEQADNGRWVRMALLSWVFEKELA